MITRFSARGWKNLADFEVALGRRVVLIGPNNCGKTNFLSGLGLAHDVVNRGMSPSLAVERRGAGALTRRGRGDGPISLAWGLGLLPERLGSAQFAVLDICIGLLEKGARVTLANESWATRSAEVSRNGGVQVRPLGNIEAVIAGLSDLVARRNDLLDGDPVLGTLFGAPWDGPGDGRSLMDPDQPGRFVAFSAEPGGGYSSLRPNVLMADGLRVYHASDFALRDVVRGNVFRERPSLLGPQAVELIPFLRDHDAVLSGAATWLAGIVRGLTAVRVHSQSSARAWLEAEIDGAWVDFAELSDGTVHALILATLLASAEPHHTLCIDEPELNLHPAWLAHVGRWIRESPAGQILVSTHSPELLDALSDGWEHGEVDVLVFEPTDHGAEIHRAEPDRLRLRLDEGWRLGDMYRVGEPFIGGWPGVRWVGAPRGG